jgi:uncharacterized membrane protein
MNLIWYFLLYSFAGFGAEVLYARISHANKQDRKCQLFLPLCPVYGIGASAIVSLPVAITTHLALLFLASVVIASGVEYTMSLFYEKVWGVSFWDYSTLPGNIYGRICMPFSFVWGVLGVILVRYIHPLVTDFVHSLPSLLAIPILFLVFLDFILTTLLLRRSHNTDDLIWYR